MHGMRNFPIVTASGEKARWQDYEVMLAPKELERVSREILSAAKLDAHMVASVDKGIHNKKQPNMDCQPTEITALMRHRAVFS